MEWKLPRASEIRYVTCYALLPIKAKDNDDNPYRVWLGRYVKRQKYYNGWMTVDRLTLDAYNQRVKYNKLYEDKTGIKFDKSTVQELLDDVDYNAAKID